MQGFTFANNYSEAAYPFSFDHQEANGAYTGTFEKFAITGNVFNNTGGWIDYRGNIVDARPCKIDGNVYLGNQRWRLGLTQANPPASGIQGLHELRVLCGRAAGLAELCSLGEEVAGKFGVAAVRFRLVRCLPRLRSAAGGRPAEDQAVRERRHRAISWGRPSYRQARGRKSPLGSTGMKLALRLTLLSQMANDTHLLTGDIGSNRVVQ